MRPRSPSSQQEASMASAARQAVPRETRPLEKLRLACLGRGSAGLLGLGQVFRKMDKDSSSCLSLEELQRGLQEAGAGLSDEETAQLFAEMDTGGSGSLDLEEIMAAIRPELKSNRKALIQAAFDRLDRDDSGLVTLSELQGVYGAERHPLYRSGEMTAEQVVAAFLKKFEQKTSVDGKISEAEFFDYYAGVSASIADDAYFDLMMRNAWGLE